MDAPDSSGYDNGAYGLRLRPIDMQKFGILFLAEGCWAGRQLLSRDWVQTSFTPWMRTQPGLLAPNYGWYWWRDVFQGGLVAHTANGWKGQRISVFVDEGIVVSMTALAENGTEDSLYSEVINRFVLPAIMTPTPVDAASLEAQLQLAIDEAGRSVTRIPSNAELRMVPSAAPKEAHHQFRP